MEDTQIDKVSTPVENFISDTEQINLPKNDSPIDEQSKSSSDLEASAKMARILQHKDKKTDIQLKWLYGVVIIIVLSCWEWFVINVVRSQLNPNKEEIFHLSDAVLIALLTTATANILALPAIILSYLFPKRK